MNYLLHRNALSRQLFLIMHVLLIRALNDYKIADQSNKRIQEEAPKATCCIPCFCLCHAGRYEYAIQASRLNVT